MTDEIHPGVQLLIKRMETNPEEFLTDNRWYSMVLTHQQYFSEADKKAYDAANNKLHMDNFHSMVMKELLDPAPPAQVQSPFWTAQQQLSQQQLSQQYQYGTLPQGGIIQVTPTTTTTTTTATLGNLYGLLNTP